MDNLFQFMETVKLSPIQIFIVQILETVTLLLIFNLNADRLSNKGLFCILDSKDMKSNLFEAYLFSDNTFISFYLEIIKNYPNKFLMLERA
mgnify:CR=1 FL=1